MKTITAYREEKYGYFLDSVEGRLLGVNKADGTVLIEGDGAAGAIPIDSIIAFEVRMANQTCTLGINTTSGFTPVATVALSDYTEAQDWVVWVNFLHARKR